MSAYRQRPDVPDVVRARRLRNGDSETIMPDSLTSQPAGICAVGLLPTALSLLMYVASAFSGC